MICTRFLEICQPTALQGRHNCCDRRACNFIHVSDTSPYGCYIIPYSPVTACRSTGLDSTLLAPPVLRHNESCYQPVTDMLPIAGILAALAAATPVVTALLTAANRRRQQQQEAFLSSSSSSHNTASSSSSRAASSIRWVPLPGWLIPCLFCCFHVRKPLNTEH
jgi:hypothetical protein